MKTQLALLALLALATPARGQAQFRKLDPPAGYTHGEAMDVSDDGQVVVGSVWPNFEAYRWTDAGGFQLLGVLAGVSSDSSAQAISGDGEVVVGWGSSPNVIESWRWEAASGMTHLPALGGAQSVALSAASAIDRSGSLVGGYSYDQSLEEGTIWALGQAPLSTGFLVPNQLSGVEAIAADVPLAVGWNTISSWNSRATKWDALGGLVDLGVLAGDSDSYAAAVSDDGTRILGTSYTSTSARAFAWTAGTGMLPLGNFPAGTSRIFVRDCDATGTRFVGSYELAGVEHGFYGSPSTGVVILGAQLAALGATGLSGNLLPQGLSADGNVIVGTVVGSNGDRSPFVARLAPAGGALVGQDSCAPAVTNSVGAAPDLAAYGSDVAADNDLTLYADDLPPGKFALFLVSSAADFVPAFLGGAGTLCLGQPIGRLRGPAGAQLIGSSGSLLRDVDLSAVPQPGGALPTLPGTTWHFQLWYRDGPLVMNFSSSRVVSFQ